MTPELSCQTDLSSQSEQKRMIISSKNKHTKFASREIHFLKTDSKNSNIKPPENYLSDILLTKPALIKTFTKRLKSTFSPEEAFFCAGLQLIPQYPDDTEKSAQKVLKAALKKLKQAVDGKNTDEENQLKVIQKSLNDDTAFILAFQAYGFDNDEKHSSSVVSRLKEYLSEEYAFEAMIGIAEFPYMDYPKTQIAGNALKALDHAAFFGPGSIISFDALSLNIAGDRLYQLSHYELAVKDYKEGLKIKPEDSNMLNSLGVCFGISGELEKAKKSFKSVLKNKPDELMALYNTGLLYQIEGEIDKAYKYLQKAHNIDNKVFEVGLLLAYLFFKKKEYKKALSYLNAAEQTGQEAGLAFRIRGEILLTEDKPEEAEQHFNKAVKMNPFDTVSISGYARCLELLNKNLPIALIFAKKSLELDPDNLFFKERLEILTEKINHN